MVSKRQRYRPDRDGSAKSQYIKNRKRVILPTDVCAICGHPLDKTLKFPHPMSVTADHIVPISLGGSPTDPDNLQAVHLICNQLKGSKLTIEKNKVKETRETTIGNDDLPLSMKWLEYREE